MDHKLKKKDFSAQLAQFAAEAVEEMYFLGIPFWDAVKRVHDQIEGF